MTTIELVYWITAFLLPLGIVWGVTPAVIRFAHQIGAVDLPDERKVHLVSTPRFGGIGILLAIGVSFPILYLVTPLFDGILDYPRQILFITSALIALFLLGVRDDIKSLNPGIKFAVQFLVATMAYAAGFSISAITHPLGEGLILVGALDFPLTLLWIVGITNAFNLIDGLDGLATGVATIALFSIFIVSYLAGDIWTAAFVLVMAGALIGFLRFNFHPARIFLGDSGSLMIGFFLALISIQSTTKISTGFTLLFPVIVLIFPITDTLISMVRRFLASVLNDRDKRPAQTIAHKLYGMFKPDRSHIHHQLLSLGFSHRGTVLTLYAVCTFFALAAMLYTQVQSPEQSLAILLFSGLALTLGIKQLRYYEISIFQNGLILPFYEKWVVNRKHYLQFFDLLFIVLSTIAAFGFAIESTSIVNAISAEPWLLILVASIQLFIFQLSGLYRGGIRQPGIGNALVMTTSVLYASAGTVLVLMLAGKLANPQLLPFLFVHFYLLLTLVAGLRMSYGALSYWFSKHRRGGRPVLIYGANENGIMILNKLTHSQDSGVRVVGFLDEDPATEGEVVCGYPVLGNHWSLDRILKQEAVKAIYLCEDNVKTEDLNRLKRVAGQFGIELKRLHVELKQLDLEPAPINQVPVRPLKKQVSMV